METYQSQKRREVRNACFSAVVVGAALGYWIGFYFGVNALPVEPIVDEAYFCMPLSQLMTPEGESY